MLYNCQDFTNNLQVIFNYMLCQSTFSQIVVHNIFTDKTHSYYDAHCERKFFCSCCKINYIIEYYVCNDVTEVDENAINDVDLFQWLSLFDAWSTWDIGLNGSVRHGDCSLISIKKW